MGSHSDAAILFDSLCVPMLGRSVPSVLILVVLWQFLLVPCRVGLHSKAWKRICLSPDAPTHSRVITSRTPLAQQCSGFLFALEVQSHKQNVPFCGTLCM